MYRAVFIDRDGTIAEDVHYCSRPEDFRLLPTAGEGIRLLNESGFKVILITNQSGIARGYFTEDMLGKIHKKMQRDLANYGAYINAIYYCPHHPDERCECRKPKPSLVYRAAEEYNIELDKSFFIGDELHDVEAGHSAGCKTVLISSESLPQMSNVRPDFKAHDFLKASRLVIEMKGV